MTLRWTEADRLSPEQRDLLIGPGAPYELRDEPVLGTTLPCFAPRPRSLREALIAGAARFGDRPFMRFPDREYTFASVLGPVASVAAALRDRYGVGPGDRVAIVSPNTAAHAITAWAAVCLGAIATELNGWWTGPEIGYGVELTEPTVLFGDDRRLARLGPAAGSLGIPVVRFEDCFDELEAHAPGAVLPDTPLAEDDAMVIMFTSGTTGRPKGATLSHRNHIHMAMQSLLSGLVTAFASGASPDPAAPPAPSCTLGVMPMFHVSGFSVGIMGSPINGTTIAYPEPGRWTEEMYLEMTERYRPNRWSLVPTQVWRLLEHPKLGDYDISSVIAIGGGSAVWQPEMLRQIKLRMPSVRRTGMGYGSTETTGGGTGTDADTAIAVPGAVGRPNPGVQAQIRGVRGIDDGEVADGEVGEVCLRSAMNFLGYWNNPEATAACLDADRWLRTGDFGRIENGIVILESRRSDLIIRGGENVYPVEIENRIIEHPDILEVAVVGVEHRTLGQEVKAFVVVRPGVTLTAGDVQAWAAAQLAAFKVPTQVAFLDELPHNATGKVMKHALVTGEDRSVAGGE